MKQRFVNFCNKIDALSLRERIMVFAAGAGVILFFVHYTMFDPLLAKQKALRAQIHQAQDNALGIDAEIAQKVQAYAFDPDAADRGRLDAARAEVAQLGSALRLMQRGLVAPEKMVALLETLLKQHGRLRLLSLKTLPVSGLSEGAFELPKDAKSAEPRGKETAEHQVANNIEKALAGEPKPAAPTPAAPTPAAPPKAPELVYRHGVEIVLQGSYLDMVGYMAALEGMPTQLFWAQVKLDAADYPAARLTLVLYTLSLDQKWIAL